MIAYLYGDIAYKSPTQIIVDVSGVGYEIYISLHTYDVLKDVNIGKVFTYLHITQDAHILYGFATNDEKHWFLQLLDVNGIGPRVAISILSSLKPDELQQAIITHNAAIFKAIKGIGQKVAQRIILELHGKVVKVDSILPVQAAGKEAIYQEALAALTKLGMHKGTAEKAIASIIKNYEGDLTVESLIKLALSN